MIVSQLAFHILRLGLATTFVWIGILIVRDPVAWGSFLQPWAVELLPVTLREAMMVTGILDIVIGGLLLFNIFTWLAAAVISVHLAIILITSGIDAITVRDIGLLGAALALTIEAFRRR